MKKNYFLTVLTILFFGSLSFGQELLNENFDYGATTGDLTTVSSGAWANHSGSGAVGYATTGLSMTNYPNTGVGGAATISPSSGEDVNRAFAEQASGTVYGSALVSLSAVGSGNYFLHLKDTGSGFRARVGAKDDGNGKILFGIGASSSTLTYGTTAFDLNTTYLLVFSYNIDSGESNLHVLTSVVGAEPASVEATNTGNTGTKISTVALRQSSNIPTATIDGVRVATTWADIMTATTTPTLAITTPTNNKEFNPSTTEVPVNFAISNFTLSKDNGNEETDNSGDGYIKATLQKNGGAVENATFFTLNPQAIDVSEGGSYVATAELVNNNGASLSPKVMASVSFTVASYTDVVNLAALRAGTEGTYYKVTGAVAISYNASNSRNQRYIQDTSGGILIDDPSGVITTNYNVGDGLINIVGKLSSFGGVLQFVPTTDYGAAANTGNSIPPQTVTIADLNANLDTYESEWVKVLNVTFEDGDGTKVFEAKKNYNISDGTNTLVFRTNFSNADFIGQVIPSSAVNISGVAAESNSTSQILATALADIVLGLEKESIEGFSAYPNPVNNGLLTIKSSNGDEKSVTIYNVLGKRVFEQKFTGLRKQLNVSHISSGIYIMKVIEGDKVATKKLVIK